MEEQKEKKRDSSREPVFIPEDAGSATTIAINRQSLKQKESSEKDASPAQE